MNLPEDLLWAGNYPDASHVNPSKTAIICGERHISYAQLNSASIAFVESMCRNGIAQGQRIAYLGRNSDLFFAVLFGCIRGGFVLVPINWRLTPTEVGFILADCGAALAIVDAEFLGLLESGQEGPPAPILVTDQADEQGDSLRRRLSEGFCQTNEAEVARQWKDAVCLQLYTSGTTGPAKGVLISHRTLSVGRQSEFLSPEWQDFTGADVVLSPMPNFHAGGMTWMLMGLSRGCTCVLTADAAPSNIVALCHEFAVTRLWVPPTVIRMLVQLVEAGEVPRPRLQAIYYGGEAMPADLVQAAMRTLGCRFGQFYGMTETGGAVVSYLAPSDHDPAAPERLRSIGRPMPGMEIAIRGPDGRDVGDGTRGEICVRSEALMCGYWNRPDAEHEALVEGWYRTGDGGYRDPEGYLFLTHRLKDMIISGGENVYPSEVEDVLRQWSGVGDVVVVGVKDVRWGESVVAVIEERRDTAIDMDALLTFARTRLAGFKVPRRLVTLTKLPRNASGKIDRLAVKGLVDASNAASVRGIRNERA